MRGVGAELVPFYGVSDSWCVFVAFYDGGDSIVVGVGRIDAGGIACLKYDDLPYDALEAYCMATGVSMAYTANACFGKLYHLETGEKYTHRL